MFATEDDVSNASDREIRSIYLDTAGLLLRDAGTRGSGPAVSTRGSRMDPRLESIPEISAQFRIQLGRGLESQDDQTRSLSSTQLLAKTLTDLQMGARLLEQEKTRSRFVDRGQGLETAVLTESLSLLSQEGADTERLTRRYTVLTDIAGARRRLNDAVSASLKSVTQDTEQVVRRAFSGLLGLSLVQVTAAAAEVTGGISGVLASSRGVDRAAQSGIQLLAESARSASTLMEQPVLESAVRQVLVWLEEIRGGRVVSVLLERVYATESTVERLHSLIESSPGPVEPFAKALQALNDLSEDYSRQARISGQILQGARWVGGGLTTIFPQASLIMAVLYLTIGGYGILSGADYVDSPKLKLIRRIPGVRLRVEEQIVPE